jgi:hypothetical protein
VGFGAGTQLGKCYYFVKKNDLHIPNYPHIARDTALWFSQNFKFSLTFKAGALSQGTGLFFYENR